MSEFTQQFFDEPSRPPIRPEVGSRQGDAPGSLPRPVLVDAYPNFKRINDIGFLTIPVPAGFSAPDPCEAWYIFRRIKASEILLDAPLCQQIEICQRPCDPDGGALAAVSGATNLTWGDTLGLSARVVVARNAPMNSQEWTVKSAQLPGIHFGRGAQPTYSATSADDGRFDSLIVLDFPTGSIRDPRPVDRREVFTFKPNALRLQKNDTLDFALVVAGRHVNARGAGQFVGYVAACAEFTLTDTVGMR